MAAGAAWSWDPCGPVRPSRCSPPRPVSPSRPRTCVPACGGPACLGVAQGDSLCPGLALGPSRAPRRLLASGQEKAGLLGLQPGALVGLSPHARPPYPVRCPPPRPGLPRHGAALHHGGDRGDWGAEGWSLLICRRQPGLAGCWACHVCDQGPGAGQPLPEAACIARGEGGCLQGCWPWAHGGRGLGVPGRPRRFQRSCGPAPRR